MTISNEAVEAAAKIVYRTSGRYRVMPYQQAHPTCRDEAREILEAAAPIIRAECLGEAADELRKWWEERMAYDPAAELTDTEYGTQNGTTDGIGAAEKLIRARAAAERSTNAHD